MNTSAGSASVASRISTLLRTVGRAAPAGLSTAEAARRSGLNRSTAHRLLVALDADGFIERDRERGSWHLGPEVYLLGALAAERYDIRHLAADRLRLLADASGESAYLTVRRGAETVCVMEREGSFPLRSTVLREGVRFPLGVASAGLVILAFLPEREAEAYLAGDRLEREFGPAYALASVRTRLAAARRTGYSVNPGLVLEGSWGLGAAVFDADGRPGWALSLTGVESRIRDRSEQLGRLLLQQAHLLTRDLRGGSGAQRTARRALR